MTQYYVGRVRGVSAPLSFMGVFDVTTSRGPFLLGSQAVTAAELTPQRQAVTAPTVGIWCCELELSTGLSWLAPPQPEHVQARILVRLHGEPLGYLRQADPARLDLERLRTRALSEFADGIAHHLVAEGQAEAARRLEVTDPTRVPEKPLDTAALPPGTTQRPLSWIPAPTATCSNRVVSDAEVTVIVCTRNRSSMLGACLLRLQSLTYPHLEILIVDNAPSDDSTQAVVAEFAASDPRFRYVREPRPGLSAARNRGLREGRGQYLAFTDDDVAVGTGWIEGLIRGFQRSPAVGCVTGLVCTAEISSAAEAYFDARSPSWSSRCEPDLFDMDENAQPGIYPYGAGIFGTGANFAIRSDLIPTIGDFDEALGAGTLTKGGEDLDLFVRVLHSGNAIAYQPSAVVWHHHRADDAGLLSQMYGYGSGLTAYATKYLLDPSTAVGLVRRIPSALWQLTRIRNATTARLTPDVPAPAKAWTRELAGMVAGPGLYLRARRQARLSLRQHSAASTGAAAASSRQH